MLVPLAVAAMNNLGPHGFTEVLYAYVSQGWHDGSARRPEREYPSIHDGRLRCLSAGS